MNSAFVGNEELGRSRRVLSTEAEGGVGVIVYLCTFSEGSVKLCYSRWFITVCNQICSK